ncbi:MAG TPA: tetratricopeptide repeat protein [Symbiobacteriaceae bacterium]|nr:tetratricopeptide repeat protein [Symbiobacteriaceae bacterium]
MIGEKIRKARLDLGLSQQQLAGPDMNRSFISLIETGRCSPSQDTLRVIATRLGKDPAYFGEDDRPDDRVDVAAALLASAQQDLNPSGDEGVARAHQKLVNALRNLAGLGRDGLEAELRSLLMTCLRRQGKHTEAIREGEKAVELFKATGDPRGTATTYLALGAIAFHLQDNFRSRRYAEQAVLYSRGLKRAQDVQLEALVNLGSVNFRLGNYPEAVESYRAAWNLSGTVNQPEQQGAIAMGLGWALFRSGRLDAGMQWTMKAMDLLQAERSPDYYLALHNLGVIESARENWEKAYLIFQECLKVYVAQNRVTKQAAVLEDVARYWMHKGELQIAESALWDAIDLLDVEDHAFLRGRIYRYLGVLLASQGNTRGACTMLRISYQVLHMINATAELNLTRAELDRLRVQPPPPA